MRIRGVSSVTDLGRAWNRKGAPAGGRAAGAASQRPRAALDGLQDLALVVEDRDTAEQLMRVLAAIETLCRLHAADERGNCLRCRPIARRLPRRSRNCTVHAALTENGLPVWPVSPPDTR
jgi:hypothetical protein